MYENHITYRNDVLLEGDPLRQPHHGDIVLEGGGVVVRVDRLRFHTKGEEFIRTTIGVH